WRLASSGLAAPHRKWRWDRYLGAGRERPRREDPPVVGEDGMTSAGLPVVFITDELARRSATLLDSFALQRPSEGVVYCFGLDQPGAAIVTTLVVPDADTSGGCIRTSARANA